MSALVRTLQSKSSAMAYGTAEEKLAVQKAIETRYPEMFQVKG